MQTSGITLCTRGEHFIMNSLEDLSYVLSRFCREQVWFSISDVPNVVINSRKSIIAYSDDSLKNKADLVQVYSESGRINFIEIVQICILKLFRHECSRVVLVFNNCFLNRLKLKTIELFLTVTRRNYFEFVITKGIDNRTVVLIEFFGKNHQTSSIQGVVAHKNEVDSLKSVLSDKELNQIMFHVIDDLGNHHLK